ncbi:hypothetical protein ASD50_19600 [Mesorhizobium sp. Root552]|uniref:GT-D fold domain-containing protein n=1 Tax=Mesorhizobium sp. Root552 TaxID=1736555 RepID=UPI0007005E48|nr:hypothetical protein [Mesorhizobium sp. Root552]KQZ28528.1 hypothetical protein ASD50_19600 [Mesorhizobium sp. Root552]
MFVAVKMLQFHREGLRRFSRIIDGNPHYDDLLEHKLSHSEWSVFDSDVDISEKRAAATTLFERKLKSRTYNIIAPEFSGIWCDGTTKNNLREFKFFERVCSSARIKLSDKNYSNCDRITISNVNHEFEDVIKVILSDAHDFYNERSTITAGLAHQQILYSRSFFSYFLAFSREGVVRPTALVQANDHSPGRVALSMIMKGLGIPRIYLQHAEVTSHFPELDFEYSVLRNRQSLHTYQMIGPVRGKVYVIPRHRDAFARDTLSRTREQGITVTIYPTSRILINELRTLIAALEKNPAIGKILLKQHPGAVRLLDNSLESSNVAVVTDIPTEDHIALVGNSSVVIELLHRGIPVYQNFEFDPVDADYYGFVKTGLTKKVALQDLSEVFWDPYHLSENWLKAYAEWDSSADPTYMKEQVEFVEEIARLAREVPSSAVPLVRSGTKAERLRAQVRGRVKRGLIKLINANPKTSARAANLILNNANRTANFLSVQAYRAARYLSLHTAMEIKAPAWQGAKKRAGKQGARGDNLPGPELSELIEYTLHNVGDPVEWLRHNERAQWISSVAMITIMDAMFQNRSPTLNVIFDSLKDWPSESVAGTWAYLKKIEWGNFEISHNNLDEIARFTYAYQDNIKARALLEQQLLTALLRSGTCAQLDSFWHNATAARKDRLSINRQIQLLRKLRSTPGREKEAEQTLREFEERATPFEVLKLRNMDALEGQPLEGWNHVHAERQFVESAPYGISREFTSHIQPVYNALRSRMRFMNARTDTSEAEAFLTLIRSAIIQGKPFSMIRLGDGEGYLFPKGDFFSEADSANRERHWWGTELDAELRAKIIDQGRQALASADVVGIPSIYRFIRDHSERSRSLTQAVQGRGLLQVLQGVEQAIAPEALIAGATVNVSMFSDVGVIASLANLVNKVTIVGSVKADKLPRSIRSLPRMEMIPLPTHARTSLNGKYNKGTEPLPFIYHALLERLDSMVTAGDLVLVAGGIIGKIFVGHARAKGAIALDIGSVLDDWIAVGMRSMR